MELLNSEEEEALRELIRVHKVGDDVSEFIGNRLYVELSRGTGERDALGVEKRELFPGFHEQEEIYKNLAAKGYLVRHRMFGGLTSAGRCYFTDKEKVEKERREAIWSDRRFQIGLSVATLVLSTIAGYISGHVTIPS